MPKVTVTFDDESAEYFVDPYKGGGIDKEYQVIVDMKSSHYRNMLRNRERVQRDQKFLQNFFIEAQMIGRAIREL